MKIQQKGFGIVVLMLAIVVIGLIGATGWYVYSRNQSTPQKIENKASEAYSFTPVSIDTSDWLEVQPFQGFSLKMPPDWSIDGGGQFSSQRIDGSIQNPQPGAEVFKHTSFFSPNITVSNPDGSSTPKALSEVTRGAKLALVMTLKPQASAPPKDPCAEAKSTYPGSEPEAIVFERHTACQLEPADTQYVFQIESSKVKYDMTLSFAPDTSYQARNEYISTARAVVESFRLY
jgi:hypothetical protein